MELAAWRVCFNKIPSQEVVTWNVILGGCAMHGHGKEALKHLEQMCEASVQRGKNPKPLNPKP